jgi:glycosyltransferase involved in cell wall biosynthesis
MKVLHVTPSYYPAMHLGGTVQFLSLLCPTLQAQGVEIEVVTTNAGLEDHPEISTSQWTIQQGVKVRYFKYWGYLHYNFSPPFFFWLMQNVKNYDAVHITAVWNFPVWAASVACRWHKIPYILSPHGVLYPETMDLRSTHAKKLYYKLVAGKCLQKASLIHYTTLDEQQKVTDFLHPPTPGLVAPPAIRLSDFDNLESHPPFSDFFPILQNRTYLLFLGRVDYKKGLDILIPAFAKILSQYPDYLLAIAGPDNDGYGETIKKQIHQLGLTDSVVFTGMLNGSAKIAAYRDAELFVLSSYSENFGMTVVEAMASYTPVVITNRVGLYNELLTYNAGVITEANVESVADGLYKVLSDGLLEKELVANGRKIVKELYDIEAVARTLTVAYEEMAAKHS